MTSPKLEETLSRLKLNKEVKDVLIIDKEGFTIRSTMGAEETAAASKKFAQLLEVIRKELEQCDMKETPQYIKLCCKKYDVMISPNEQYALIITKTPGDHP
eukprot:TRINITY_DN948_c0_g1_i10.p2 TRINITY_DN948_c0_g1~~TRINITY_DN948_c0_g1_i10.p2  ORF type:complete len:101 (-),score=29.10 TRINITY_DN948_c0_g1_i10:145-447(-)